MRGHQKFMYEVP